MILYLKNLFIKKNSMTQSKTSRNIAYLPYWPDGIAQIIIEYVEYTLIEKFLILLARSRGSCIDFIIQRQHNYTLLFQLKWKGLYNWYMRKIMPTKIIDDYHKNCSYTVRFAGQYKTILPDGRKRHKNYECYRKVLFTDLVDLLTTSDWKLIHLEYYFSFTGVSVFKEDQDAVYKYLHRLLTRYC